MRNKEYFTILQHLAELIDEGVQCVDAEGITFLYNKTMAELEETDVHEVIGKSFKEIYPYFPEEQSTLLRALRKTEPTINQQQTYFNRVGKEITTINTTIPLLCDDKLIGALEVAKDVSRLKELSDKLIEYQGGRKPNAKDQKRITVKQYCFDDIIGQDKRILELKRDTKRIADNPYPVMILGETGTGKELFAQSIHFTSARADKPFLAQNCAALPASLLEGILFGTTKGAFTGAEDRAGLFEQASGGTLLLDEINAMPIHLQSKLLRVLQENYVRRIGGNRDIPVDVRVIAISNEPLGALIEKGEFRRDLYYRLNAIEFLIPPLRKRKGDIPILVEAFINKHRKKLGKNVLGISKEAEAKLMDYDYSGNVRELENIIVSAMSMVGEGEIIEESDIQFNRCCALTNNPFNHNGPHIDLDDVEDMTLPEKLKHIENALIDSAMKENHGNVSKAAQQLGIKRQSLQYKISQR